MKKAYAILGAISALSLMAVSCQKEVSNVVENAEKVHMTIIASGDAETKTVLQEDGKTVLWDSEENLAVLETIVGAESTNTTYVASSNGVSTDEGNTMTFDVAFDKNTTGSSYTYNAIYPNSSYVTNANTEPESFKVITPTTQKATATSFDGDADLLIAKPVTENSQQTTLNLAFKRMVVVGKMTLTNVQTEGFVKSVKFSSADKVITGKSKLNLTTGEAVEYGYEGTGNRVDYVEVTYAANDIPANGLTVYFTCLPFEIAAGEKFTVTLTTKDDKTFTREVTIPAGRKLSFAVGKNTKFSVDMAEAVSGESVSLAGKNYVILSRYADKDGNISGNYAYMTSTLSSTYYVYGTTAVSATNEINTTNSKIDFPNVTDYWAVEVKGDNYAIKSVTSGMYVAYPENGKNQASQSDSPYELKIVPVEGTPGMYQVSSVSSNTRRLQYNGNSGQERFAFYTGTQNDLFLIPVGEDYVAPTLNVDPTSLIFNAEGGSQTIEATASNFAGIVTITATSNNTQFTTSVSGTAVTVTAAANTDNAVKTGKITITATDGTTTKTAEIEVSQDKPAQPAQPAQDGDILWQEDFTGYGTTLPATATGTHVFEGGTVSYTLTDGGSTTKLYNENNAGGTKPELLVSKTNGSFKVSGIPTGNATALTLTYNANYDYCVITASNDISLRNDATFGNKLKTVVLIVPAGVTSFDLEFKNTNDSNCRVDNFMLVAGASKMKETQTITFGDNKNVEWVIGTDCTLNTAKQGLTVTGAQTTVNYSSSNTEVATVDNNGMVTPLKAGTVTITANAAETDDYKAATDSYMLTITDPNAETKQYTLSIDASNFNTTSYAANNNEKTSNAVTTDGSTFEVKWTSNQVMKSGDNMQWQKNNGYIYNSTNLGTIKSVTVTSSAGTFTTYYGETTQPSSSTSVGGSFFQIKVGNATGTSSKIEIVFEK